ncbi:MAG TPA: GNAT family N-acetyltransferase [Acidimicrobiales bacterium]|nr:GNAT family N-acetyltransferase [Acidimicrobiales bacterium]
MTESPCLFDRILDGSAPAHTVLDEATVAGFLDVRPVFKGHTLVVPRTHVETVADLGRGVLGELMEAGRRVAAAQRTALGCTGTLFALNDIVSQSVPHVHLHVVPRTRGDGLRGFMWPRTKYADEAEAAATASSIRRALDAVTSTPQQPEEQVAPDQVLVRDALPVDTARLAQLLAGGTLRAVEDPSDPAAYEPALAEILAAGNATILVAEVGGRVMGMCQLIWFRHLQERGGLCAELESVHVDAAMRSHGVGGILVEAAVSRAEALGCYRIQLTSHRSRVDARRFYERHGFEPSHVGFKRYLP